MSLAQLGDSSTEMGDVSQIIGEVSEALMSGTVMFKAEWVNDMEADAFMLDTEADGLGVEDRDDMAIDDEETGRVAPVAPLTADVCEKRS